MAVAAFLAGCLGAGDEAEPATGPPRAIAELVQRLERATADHDFQTICRDLLTPSARRSAGGPDCARLTRSAAAGVERPRIELISIDLGGATARAHVRTRATGQALVSDVLVVRQVGREWRVDSLGG
jgi:hypothetical protein